LYGNTSEAQAASYDRDHPLYPYKSHGQWLKGCYGLVCCIVLILFNGVAAFIEPFNVRKFVSAYISVSPGFPLPTRLVPSSSCGFPVEHS
jgi:amino acid transporter